MKAGGRGANPPGSNGGIGAEVKAGGTGPKPAAAKVSSGTEVKDDGDTGAKPPGSDEACGAGTNAAGTGAKPPGSDALSGAGLNMAVTDPKAAGSEVGGTTGAVADEGAASGTLLPHPRQKIAAALRGEPHIPQNLAIPDLPVAHDRNKYALRTPVLNVSA